MKSIINLPVAILMICVVACTDNYASLPEDSVWFSVFVPRFETGITTRTSMSGSTTSFTSGDMIGISETLTGRYNVPFSYNGNLWTTISPLYWRDGTSIHTFYAYYPYNSSGQGVSVSVPILNGQTVAKVPDPSCDMLVTSSGKTQARSGGSGVSLTMQHALALLRFDIKMSVLNLLNPYILDSLIVRGGNTAGGTNPYGMNSKSRANLNQRKS